MQCAVISIYGAFLYFGVITLGKLKVTKAEINYWIIKFTKTPILPNCQVPSDYFSISLEVI